MKYKVGDRVSVRSDLVVGCSYGGFVFVEEMKDFLGKECLITHAERRCYELNNVDTSEFAFTDEMLEHEEITSKGLEALERLWDGCVLDITCKNDYDTIKQDLEHYHNALQDKYDYSKCLCYDELLVRCKHLEKENQELKEKADKYDSAQRIVLSTKGIDVIMKLQAKNEKLKEAIEVIKQYIQLDLECNTYHEIRMGREMIVIPQQEYDLLKEVLE